MDSLPKELLIRTFHNLSPHSLAKVSTVLNVYQFDSTDFLILLSQNPWFNSVIYNSIEVLKWLLNINPTLLNTKHHKQSALVLSSQLGHIEIVKFLLQKDINKSVHNVCNALLQAVHNNHVDITTLLIKNDNVNCNCHLWDETLLIRAIRMKHIEIIKLLLNNKADIKYYSRFSSNPLEHAIQSGNIEVLETVVRYHNDKDWENYVLSNNVISVEVMEWLLNQGVDINTKMNEGKTLLFCACERKSLELLKFLLDNKIDVNVQDNTGSTALHYSVEYKSSEFTEILLQYGANPNIYNNKECTPLVNAIASYQLNNIKLLVKHGANLDNIRPNDGALFIAVQECSPPCYIKFLIESGAKATEGTLYIALSNGNKAVIDMLMDMKVMY